MPDSNAIPRTPEPDAKPPLTLRLADRLGLLDPVRIVPFPSFGTPDLLRVPGRVVEQRATAGTTEESSLWENVSAAVQRLGSNDIPGARLRARFGGVEAETTTDGEGYFVFNLALSEPVESGWHEVEVEWLESIGVPAERTVRARVLVPDPGASFAVVSDIDDTVVESHASDRLRLLAVTFGKGARERVSFPGVPEFYRALARGAGGAANPIFFTTRSGWNLSDLFVEFLATSGIPQGPLLMHDLHVFEARSQVLRDPHDKFASIDLLLRTYPELPFLLIGDSGQHDPELYLKVIRAHPGRVRAVYLHDVTGERRDAEVQRVARAIEAEGVPARLAEDTLAAAAHAAERGWITPEALAEVRRGVEGGTEERL